MKTMEFPVHIQRVMECGPTCLYLISKYYGRKHSISKLKRLSNTTRKGSTLLGLSKAAEQIGFKASGVKITFEQLALNHYLPCIAYINDAHYVVVYKIRPGKVYLSDPACGMLLIYPKQLFLRAWVGKSCDYGVALILEPTEPAQQQAN